MNDQIKKFPIEHDTELIREMDRYVKASLNDKEIKDIKAKEDIKLADMVF